MKILLFKPGAMGDVLMTTPLVRQLRRLFSKARIDYLVGKKAFEILENNKYIDKAISFEEDIFYQKRLRKFLKLSCFIRKGKYDAIFVLNKHRLYNLAAFFWRIPKRIGFDRCGEGIFLTYKVPFYGGKHEIFYYLDLIYGLGAKPDYQDWKPEVFLSPRERRFADNFWKKNELFDKKVIGICPGGGVNIRGKEEIKRWPPDKYIELIKRMKKKNLEVVLIGDKQDKDAEKEVLRKVKCFSLIGKTSFLEAGAILAKCQGIVCTDSGLMHLASATNERIVSIFGPTNPIEKAPLHQRSRWIWKPKVGCAPCYDLKGRFPLCKNRRCLNLISPKEVFENILSIL